MLKFECDHCKKQIEDVAGEHCHSDGTGRVFYCICPYCGTTLYAMSEKSKELLAYDLGSRLPYGVKVAIWNEMDEKYKIGTLLKIHTKEICGTYTIVSDAEGMSEAIEFCIPYLRPMNSMTQREKSVYNSYIRFTGEPLQIAKFQAEATRYLYSRMLDVNNLIERGLARPAPDDMYTFED